MIIPLTKEEAIKLQDLYIKIDEDRSTEEEKIEYLSLLEKKHALKKEDIDLYKSNELDDKWLKQTLLNGGAMFFGFVLSDLIDTRKQRIS